MKANQRKFSTLSGILWIASFFCLLLILPAITLKKQHEFKPPVTNDKNSPPSLSTFPIDTKLTVFRDLISGKNRPRSKITLKDLIKDAKGPILINFWATWCPPCLEELPSIEMLHRQILSRSGDRNARLPKLITISVDDRSEDISKLEATLDFKPSFTVVHDKEGELARTMGTTKFPETYLINSEGKILYKWLGPQDWLSHDVLQQLKNLVD